MTAPSFSTGGDDDDGALELPASEHDDGDVEPADFADLVAAEIELPDDDDPFDDRVATDLMPIAALIEALLPDEGEPGASAVGDDATGVDGDELLAELAIGDGSLLGDADEGGDGLEDEDFVADAPSELDDGGAEGVDDPSAAEVVDLPPIDGDEVDEDAELDVGIELRAVNR